VASGRDVVGAAVMMIIGISTLALASGGPEPDDPGPAMTVARIKTEDPEIARAIALAIDWSDTFRRLVETIERTDGMVWIVRGRCHAMSACLLIYLEVSGPNRMLRIHVDPRQAGERLMESMGHELRHAVEVLGTSARTSAAMYHFFDRQAGAYRIGGRFETNEAVEAGLAVGREVARARRLTSSPRR
jgi:hypothetical protein